MPTSHILLAIMTKLPVANSSHSQNSKLRYIKASLLLSGPFMFVVGGSFFVYSKISSGALANAEWVRYSKERNNALDSARSKEQAEKIKAQKEAEKLQLSIDKNQSYFADIPIVVRSSDGATLINFGKLINGESAQYSYKVAVGQAVYDVQGEISARGNSLYYSDNYNKSNSEILSEGEIRHEKDEQTGNLRLTFITSKNIGGLSKLGDVRVFDFKYK